VRAQSAQASHGRIYSNDREPAIAGIAMKTTLTLMVVAAMAAQSWAVTFTASAYNAKNDVKTVSEVNGQPFDQEIEIDSVVQQGGLNWFETDTSKTRDGGDTHASTYFIGGCVGTSSVNQWTLTDYISAEVRAAPSSWAECVWRNKSFVYQTYWSNYDGVVRYEVEFIGNTPGPKVRHPQFQKYKYSIDASPDNGMKYWFDGNTRKWRVQGNIRSAIDGTLIPINYTSGVHAENQQFKYTKTTYGFEYGGLDRHIFINGSVNGSEGQKLDTSVNGDSEYDGYNSLQVKRTGWSFGPFPF
jgi:hypothetical protein